MRLLLFSVFLFSSLYCVGQTNNQLIKIYQPQLVYPTMSRRLGEEGLVEFLLSVNEQGAVESVELIQSSGFFRLDEAGKKLVSMIRFEPLKFEKNIKLANATIKVRYQLGESSQSEHQNDMALPVLEEDINKIKKYQKVETQELESFSEKNNAKQVNPVIKKNPLEIKRQKCINLGLAPGSADFQQCIN